jgi:hypothetical protein
VAGKLEILAVTLPICAVPPPSVTEPEIATVFPIVTEAIDIGWVAGKLEMETDENVTEA